jgi:hypothetical protein
LSSFFVFSIPVQAEAWWVTTGNARNSDNRIIWYWYDKSSVIDKDGISHFKMALTRFPYMPEDVPNNIFNATIDCGKRMLNIGKGSFYLLSRTEWYKAKSKVQMSSKDLNETLNSLALLVCKDKLSNGIL